MSWYQLPPTFWVEIVPDTKCLQSWYGSGLWCNKRCLIWSVRWFLSIVLPLFSLYILMLTNHNQLRIMKWYQLPPTLWGEMVPDTKWKMVPGQKNMTPPQIWYLILNEFSKFPEPKNDTTTRHAVGIGLVDPPPGFIPKGVLKWKNQGF